mgnify:CR=1 FL=1
MEVLSLASMKNADEGKLESDKYKVVAIPAKVQSSGKLDLQEAAGLVQATVVADLRQFRRRFARWVGKVCDSMSSAGETEDVVAQFRRGGALFLVKIGVGTKAFAFGGRKSPNDESRFEVSSFMYRYISRDSCSHFDSPPLTSLTLRALLPGESRHANDGDERGIPRE